MANRIDSKTIEDLEFPIVLQQVANSCLTTLGKEAALQISPFPTTPEITLQLERTNEFLQGLPHTDNPIPNHGFEAITKELKALEIENNKLSIHSFQKLVALTLTTQTLLAFFKKNKLFYKALFEFSDTIQYTDLIRLTIQEKINRFGEVKNNASALLETIRADINKVKGVLQKSFTEALQHYGQLDYLDDIRETVVDNRRVLAVKAMHRKKVKGAVLGASKTGSIIYIEPQQTLELSSKLTHLVFEESEEISRILKALTSSIKPYKTLLNTYQDFLTTIDVLYAKASYAKTINGVVPRITKNRSLQLINAFHPLLLLSNKRAGKATYSQSIKMHDTQRIIVISGPNAGGKSITLKTVGLLQLMWQSGLLISADASTEMCVFDRILTDIGDNQSIENHLSTYSYRLKKMNSFLKKSNANTLLLIDEFGTGSDPELGGALAETFLEVFYEQQAFALITTHYSNLKLLAEELPHALNANMLFNNRSLEPEFKLQLGEAGSSFTFEVAQKNGIPYSLINKAKKKITRDKVRFDRTIANLQKERQALRHTTAKLKTNEEKAKEEGAQLAETQTKIQQKLESFQTLYDVNQRLITLGKRVDALAERFHQNRNKKVLFQKLS